MENKYILINWHVYDTTWQWLRDSITYLSITTIKDLEKLVNKIETADDINGYKNTGENEIRLVARPFIDDECHDLKKDAILKLLMNYKEITNNEKEIIEQLKIDSIDIFRSILTYNDIDIWIDPYDYIPDINN